MLKIERKLKKKRKFLNNQVKTNSEKSKHTLRASRVVDLLVVKVMIKRLSQ